MNRTTTILFVLSGVIASILFHKKSDFIVNNIKKWYNHGYYSVKPENVFTPEELSEYDGKSRSELYLAFMGTVFDVSQGRKHYGRDSAYSYFVGKDGTRAFVTGNFNDNSENKDHILDLSCNEILALMKWKKTLKGKYKFIGYLMGRYYDSEAKATDYYVQCSDRVDHCLEEIENDKEENRKYPPCNISWSPEDGTRVWCTKSSGGISRGWIGVPRQLYTPGSDKPRCVCVKDPAQPSTLMFKEYDNCSNTSTSCNVQDQSE